MMKCKKCRIAIALIGITIMLTLMHMVTVTVKVNSPVEQLVPVEVLDSLPTPKKDTNLYETAIVHIKSYEGFREKTYIDNDGSKTIGYGHHIQKGESFMPPISEYDADSVLKEDLNKRIVQAQKFHGDTLSESESIAIAMFIFNCGSGTYGRSSIITKIRSNIMPDDTWVQYCKYKKDGVYVAHPKLKTRREFELKLYNYVRS